MNAIRKALVCTVLAASIGGAMAAEPMANSSDVVQSVVQKININSADAKQLSALPGIGAKKAAAIVKYRDQHGGFKSIDELEAIKGISKRLLDKMRDLITL